MSALQESNPVPWAVFWKGPFFQFVNRCFPPPTISHPHGLATFVAELSQSINSGHISSNGKVSRGTFFSSVNLIVSLCVGKLITSKSRVRPKDLFVNL